MKLGIYIVLGLAVVIGWISFMTSGKGEIHQIEETISRYYETGSVEELEQIPTLKDKIENIKSSKTLTGILLAFVTAGLVGVVVVVDLLPLLAHKFTHAVYDSGEEVEEDPMHDAHAKLAQGDFDGAIAAFRDAAAMDPMNRLPYVEIAKVQREQLKQPHAAVETLREAIEGQEWQENDAAFLMFRLAEVYDEDLAERMAAVGLMQQVIEQFPESRHSANARHKLHEWGVA
ncbi:tetratricopeptide (TPR) repeat protein [Haloferula luteola]|uniref:Tetratricopeptide (TPR) repeat protein n=1 Tax=Haloferula luteola TaxID=595692 RepID=A0A840V554_9BACT|nr:tetratricopeptide repeat protein [Haloferula luteola]MBB5352733.1 tetratricopeptide (TPR) repeat protein [Haloferula luteola]